MRVRGSLSFTFRISPACLGPKLKCASSPPCRWYPVLSLAGKKKGCWFYSHPVCFGGLAVCTCTATRLLSFPFTVALLLVFDQQQTEQSLMSFVWVWMTRGFQQLSLVLPASQASASWTGPAFGGGVSESKWCPRVTI